MVAKSEAGKETVNWVGETKVVVLGDPLKFTTAPETKSVPFMVKVVAALPTGREEGEIVVVLIAMAAKGIAPSNTKPAARAEAAKRRFFVFMFMLFVD